MKNKKRFLTRFLADYAHANSFSIESLSHDWIFLLSNGARRHCIFGYDLGVNSSSTFQVCRDKAATYEVLHAAQIPCVEHRVFLNPSFLMHLPIEGNWDLLLNCFRDFGENVVLKPNEGTAGLGVMRAQSVAEFEQAVHTILASERSVAVSPFIEIENEYRFYVLSGAVKLAISKEIPFLVGDGVNSVDELAKSQLDIRTYELLTQKNLKVMEEWRGMGVPKKGMNVRLNWRNNLGQGALPILIDATNFPDLSAIALDAAEQMNLTFGSVDIVSSTDGSASVLEVNGGVMMENLAETLQDGQTIATEIYTEALDLVFRDPS